MLWAQVQTCWKNQFSSKMYSQTQYTGRGRFQKIGPKAAQEAVQRGVVSKIEQGTSKLNKRIIKSDCMHTYINSLYIYLVYLIYNYAPRSFLEEYEHQVQGHPGLNGNMMVNYGLGIRVVLRQWWTQNTASVWAGCQGHHRLFPLNSPRCLCKQFIDLIIHES